MRKITKNPRLVKKRDELIYQLKVDGFFYDEIGLIFRLRESRVCQIFKKVEKQKKVK